MVVQSNPLALAAIDLGHLALFLGLRINELVIARMRLAGFRNARESHGYLIQHLVESERSITELARRMGVSQQAASKAVAELVAFAVLEESPGKDRRSKRIRISAKGWKMFRVARKAREVVINRLQKAIGDPNYARTKISLIKCLEELGGTERIRSRRVRQPR